MNEKKGNPLALIPIGVFLILYLGTGIVFEYILKIEMGFYNIPIIVVFLIAILTACLQSRKVSFDKKLDIMAKGVGDKNIITMILIFLVAGVFVGVVGRSSAESVAYFLLSVIPPEFAVVVLFVVSCFVSTAMGTSVGTITLIAPIGFAVSAASGFSLPLCIASVMGGAASGFSLPLCIASVMGGAMFGDNLSFISDTTIAACNGQGCPMKQKFKENFFIALPAALLALIIIFFVSQGENVSQIELKEYNLIQIIPYVLVLIGGIVGINVFIVLLIGILSGAVIILATGTAGFTELLANVGSGVSGMFETAIVAVLVSALCSLIKENGGFDSLLHLAGRLFKNKKTGQLGIGLLVGVMDIATANNTVAIIMANPIAKQMSENYGIRAGKTASILDTFSCIFQGIIPYGAQMLVAISAVAELGKAITAFDIIPFLFYPFALLVSSLIFIFFVPDGKKQTHKKGE